MTAGGAGLRRAHLGAGFGWALAAAIALGAHAAGLWWLQQRATAGGPLVLDLELAPTLAAAPASVADLPPGAALQTAPSAAPLPEPQPPPRLTNLDDRWRPPQVQPLDPVAPDNAPPPDPSPLPPYDDTTAPPEPAPWPSLPPRDKVDAPIPSAARHRPPPRPQRAAPAAARTPAAAPPPIAAPAAAQPTAPAAKGRTTRAAEISWQQQVSRKVAMHLRRWPNRLPAAATVQIRFAIDGAGRVTGANVIGSTGDAAADAGLRAHALRLGTVPAPPDGAPRQLQVAVTLQPHR